MRVPVLEVIANLLRVRRCGRRPSDAQSLRAQHFLKPRVHFLFLDELPTVSLFYPLTYRRAKASIFRKQAQCGVLHQSLSVHTRLDRDLRELRFLLRSEVYFHSPNIREK